MKLKTGRETDIRVCATKQKATNKHEQDTTLVRRQNQQEDI